MAEQKTPQENDNEVEHFPVEPRYHPVNRVARLIYDKLASAKLAMLLLVAILVSCLCGGLLYKDEVARQKVFGTLWFNGFLVLLMINTACCFFGRMWRRRMTVISFGMILFHLSFVAMFAAIVFNSLFAFNGTLRLTEGETLSNRDPKSYDSARPGLFFSYSKLRGETTLLKVHRGYLVDGGDKKIAFDIVVAEGAAEKKGTVYINNKFEYKGVDYIRDQEGYSLLVIVYDRQGNELHGMHIPLQSYLQKNGSYIYGSGTRVGPGWFGFPPETGKPFFNLQLEYFTENRRDRDGRIHFKVWPITKPGGGHDEASATGATPYAGAGQSDGHKADASMHTGGGGHVGTPSDSGAMHNVAAVKIGETIA